MAVIVFVVGDKGGIGKSTWARGFADICRLNGVKTGLFDGDWICRSLFRMFSERTPNGGVVPLVKQNPRTGCILYNLRHPELGRDILLDSMGLRGIDLFLHDMPAGFRADFTQVMGIPQPARAIAEFIHACDSVGARPVFVTPITPHWATSQTAVWLVENAPPAATVIAVRNQQFNEASFSLWRGGDQERFLRAGGLEIAMPGLEPQTFISAESRSTRYSATKDDPAASLADTLRINSWLRRFTAELRPARQALGLESWLNDAAPLRTETEERGAVIGLAAAARR